MPVITISRQFGSGGEAIADRVCTLLGYRYLDKWLLRQVASEVGLSEDEVIDFSEDHYKARSFLSNLFGPRQRVVARKTTRQRTATGATALSDVRLDEAQCIDLIHVAVHAAYRRGNMLIAGRGSQIILRNKPEVLHVRVEAPLAVRCRNVQLGEGVPEQEALTMIAQRDTAAAEYLRRFFDVRWDDPQLYHLLINTGQCTLETAARIIGSATHHLSEETQPSAAIVL
jgi:cytidylate kinase